MQRAPEPAHAKLAAEICRRIAHGESLREICRTPGMPSESCVRDWAIDDRDGFSAPYGRACGLQAQHLADEILEIADNATNDWMDRQNRDGSTSRVLDREHIQRSALRVDARKWTWAKLHPELYDERFHQVLTGKDDGPVQTQSMPPPPDNRPNIEEFMRGFQSRDRKGPNEP